MQAIDLINAVNSLVQEYGIEAVDHTIEFFKNYPTKDHFVQYTIKLYDDSEAVTVRLTNEQFMSVVASYNIPCGEDNLGRPYKNKIEAIKKLRAFTGIRLHEAKDIIESARFISLAL